MHKEILVIDDNPDIRLLVSNILKEQNFKVRTAANYDQAIFEIKNLLLTSKGENISDPNYGIGLRSYIFEMNNPSTRLKIKNQIRLQMNRYMTNITFVDAEVSATSEEIDSNSLKIAITFRENQTGLNQTIEISFGEEDRRIL